MKIENLILGPLANNVYLIEGPEGVVVVDPSCKCDQILDALEGRAVAAIVLTHAHWDHVGAAKALRDATGAPVVASVADAPIIAGDEACLSDRKFEPCAVDMVVKDGQELELGGLSWQVLITPGHTPGSMCLYCAGESDGESPVLVAGDTLFRGTHGRTDFIGGSQSDMDKSLQRLVQLPGETVVLPGHNDLTTIKQESVWIA